MTKLYQTQAGVSSADFVGGCGVAAGDTTTVKADHPAIADGDLEECVDTA